MSEGSNCDRDYRTHKTELQMQELKEFLSLRDEGEMVRVCAKTPEDWGRYADIYIRPSSIGRFCDKTGRGFGREMLFDEHDLDVSKITIDTKRNTITLTLEMLPQ